MDKNQILNQIKTKLKEHFDSLIAEALQSKIAATHEESRAENKYDTRGLEASYIAEAQSKRSEQIKEDLFNLEKLTVPLKPKAITLGALVELDYQDKKSFLFILPISGISVSVNSALVKAISLRSPLGKMLYKKQEGDSFTFRGEEIEVSKIL